MMRTVSLTRRSKPLHIEAPGCIVNIVPGLTDAEGRRVVSVEIRADGKRYAGEIPWWIDGKSGEDYLRLRVVADDKP
jgi:hypothetical protein